MNELDRFIFACLVALCVLMAAAVIVRCSERDDTARHYEVAE